MIRKPLSERIQDFVYSMEEGFGALIVKIALLCLIAIVLVVLYMASQFKGLKDPHSMEMAHLGRQLHETGRYTSRIIRPIDLWFWKKQHEITDRELKWMMHAPEGGLILQKPENDLATEAVVLAGTFGPDVSDVLHELYPPEIHASVTNKPLTADAQQQALRFKHGLVDNLPEVRMAPGYPWLLSKAFWIADTEFLPEFGSVDYRPEEVLPFLGMILLLLSAPFVFFIGWRLFNRNIGLLATVFYLLSSAVWAQAVEGNEISLTIFLASVAIAAMVGMTTFRWFPGFLCWLILVLALAALLYTRFAAWTLLPCVLIYLGFALPRIGWPVAIFTVALAGASLTPWAARNLELTKSPAGLSPYSVLQETAEFPGQKLQKSIAPRIDNKKMEIQVRHKLVQKLDEKLVPTLARMAPGIIPTGLFIACLFFGFSTRRANTLRWGALLTALLTIFTASLFGDINFKLIGLIWPITACYAASFFYTLIDRAQFNLRITIQLIFSATIFAVALPLAITLLPPQPPPRYPPDVPRIVPSDATTYYPFYIVDKTRRFTTSEWLATDIPEATAWFGNQRSLLVTSDIKDYRIINDHIRTLGGILFSSKTTTKLNYELTSKDTANTWDRMIIRSIIPDSIPLYTQYEFIPGMVLFSERNRYKQHYRLLNEPPRTPKKKRRPLDVDDALEPDGSNE